MRERNSAARGRWGPRATMRIAMGVLSAALVYQCADTLEAMNEELPDAHD